jgi:hypothetical protein
MAAFTLELLNHWKTLLLPVPLQKHWFFNVVLRMKFTDGDEVYGREKFPKVKEVPESKELYAPRIRSFTERE